MTIPPLRWFSFHGRMPRGPFWLTSLVTGLLFVALFVLLETLTGRASTLVLYPVFFWAMGAALVKRLHDRAKSAWWLLLIAIPIAGPLWLALELCLVRGTYGENAYGRDPVAERTPDYLTVD